MCIYVIKVGKSINAYNKCYLTGIANSYIMIYIPFKAFSINKYLTNDTYYPIKLKANDERK